MERANLPLSHLSFAQKLDLMETLWADLSQDEGKLKSPEWHEAVLKDRQEAFAAGKAVISDWEQAKKKIKVYR
ncbi:MAG: addiction module protein [Armatimonadetes bacterium]|nr:addiction module protein [Armatimonadota bacterium]